MACCFVEGVVALTKQLNNDEPPPELAKICAENLKLCGMHDKDIAYLLSEYFG